MKTVLITGCSSGYGLETAHYFHRRGWNVVATMRRPRAGILPTSDRIKLVALDVTDAGSIARAIEEAGQIDVLVNNAGIGVVGAFEATSMQTVREAFETNTFGTMAVTQAVIPQMRERQTGTIINVTSSVTLASMPFAAAYTGSKTAVEGFTGSLAHELGAFGIRVKLVEPGHCPTTRFAENGAERINGLIPEAYAEFARPIFEAFAEPQATTQPLDVAKEIWRAAHDESDQFHFPAGADAVALAGPR